MASAELAFEPEHLHVFCSDLTSAEAWFVEKLGAELVGHRQLSGSPGVELRLAGMRLLLGGNPPVGTLVGPRPRRFGLDHFGLLVADLDACAAELQRRGVVFEEEPHEVRPGLRIAFILGPDDVRIELLEHAR